jgi:hypothetical protein
MTQLNVGNIDRSLRIALGVLLIGLAALGIIGVWGYVGIVPMATGIVAWCPMYRLFGFKTTSR